MVQLAFTRRILAGAKAMGLHTAIETSGFSATAPTMHFCPPSTSSCSTSRARIPETYRRVTGRDLAPTLRFAERLAAIGKPVWVRFTLVPGSTDDPANVEGIARFVAPMKNVEWVEVQPFHQMGAFKWKAMGLEYKHARHAAAHPRTGEPGHRTIPRRGLQRPLTAISSRHDLGGDVTCWILRATSSERQPILTAFLAIGVGYLVGQINIGGFSLGVGAVLFVGLAIGAFAPKAQIIGPIGLTGLIMFLYGIGILYGRQFFEGMVGAAGRNTICWRWSRASPGLLVALGLGPASSASRSATRSASIAGSMTSTATLQAALDVDEEQGSVDRLFDRLSVRRDRPDPVHLFHDAAA